MSTKPKVVILGAGPAGLGAALGLAKRGFEPILVEREARVGGNSGSFEVGGMRVDYGSHRLHPATDPEILATIRGLLGADLLERPRHGRILLGGRWIHFPLRPLDLALRAPPAFVFGAARDVLWKLLQGGGPDGRDSFETVLLRGLGPTICREFYFPYARKIWGLEPGEISPAQAAKRVSANSTVHLLRRLLPGGAGKGGRQGRGTYFYPRKGFGQISETLWEAAVEQGVDTTLDTTVHRVLMSQVGFRVEADGAGGSQLLSCDHLWSTIPLPALVRMMDPPPPPEVLDSAGILEQRAMLLVYLVLEQDRFTEFDAHYFPSPEIPFTRLSEPKNYADRKDPVNRTVLCAEFPCSTKDLIWELDGPALGEKVMEGLERANLPLRGSVLEVAVRRLPSAYPMYRRGYETHLEQVSDWVNRVPGIITFGRQGLFAHDNTHHALSMAKSAVLCLGDDGRFDEGRWAEFQEVFASHVVED